MSDTPSGTVVPARQGKAWSIEQDRQLYDGFVGGQSVDLLASTHARSAGGIRSRLARLGLIDQDGQVVESPPPFAPVKTRGSSIQGAPDGNAMRPVFAIRTGDGWIVEIRSNRPLNRLMVDRLTAMLHGVVVEDEA